jgi:hypothetical protein
MRRNGWVALGLVFAMLVAVPAQAGTRTKSTTKAATKRPAWGFMLTDISVLSHDPQQKLFWCAPYGDGMHEQTAGVEVNYGVGWAVFEEPQATRVRDLQSGTLTLQKLDGSWTDVEVLSWVDGRWVDPPTGIDAGEYAWSPAYEWTTHGGQNVWRSDFILLETLSAGQYRFTDVNFELTAGTVDATGGGDPPGPWMTFTDCQFNVHA